MQVERWNSACQTKVAVTRYPLPVTRYTLDVTVVHELYSANQRIRLTKQILATE